MEEFSFSMCSKIALKLDLSMSMKYFIFILSISPVISGQKYNLSEMSKKGTLRGHHSKGDLRCWLVKLHSSGEAN